MIFRRVGLDPGVPVVVYTGPRPLQPLHRGDRRRPRADDGLPLPGTIRPRQRSPSRRWPSEVEGRRKQDHPRLSRRERVQLQDSGPERVHRGYEEFKEIKDHDDVVLLDARPPKFYEGESPWSKPGPIPGELSLEIKL